LVRLEADRRVEQVLIDPREQALNIHGVERFEDPDVEVLEEVFAAESVVLEHAPKVVVAHLDDS